MKDRAFSRRLPWPVVFLGGFLCALATFALGAWLALRIVGHNNVSQDSWLRVAQASGTAVPPWGQLETLRIPLVNAEDIDLTANRLMSPPRWFFECQPD